MSIAATMVFEVRTTGSDTQCAGGFNSARGGTDYSQQDTAQATGTVTSSTTTVTATTGIFTSAMVGNMITDGTTFKEITAFTSSTVVTVDSAPAWTSATIYVGGALKSPAIAETIVVAGNTIFYLQAGSVFAISSATANVAGGRLNLNVSGSATARIRRIGYTTTRAAGNTDTRPTFQTTTGLSNNAIVTFNNANSYNSIENVILDANLQTNTPCLLGAGRCNYSDNCKFINSSPPIGIQSVIVSTNFSLERFEVSGCTGGTTAALNVGSGLGTVFDGSVHGNSARGVESTGAAPITIAFVQSYANSGASGYGFFCNASTNFLLLNCTAYSNAQDGFLLNTGNGFLECINCIADSNSGYGFNHSSAQHCLSLINCAGRNNTSGNYPTTGSTTPFRIYNFQALSASPFNNPAGGDFTLNNTAGGGAACRAAGIPGAFPGLSTTGYLDIGAVQHADPASGGLSVARPMTGGLV